GVRLRGNHAGARLQALVGGALFTADGDEREIDVDLVRGLDYELHLVGVGADDVFSLNLVRIVSVRCAHLALQLERLTDDTLGELVLEHAAEKDADRLSSRGLSDHGVVTLVDHKSISRHGPDTLDAIVGRVRET